MKYLLEKIRGNSALPARPTIWQMVNGLIGGSLGISTVAMLSNIYHLPLLIAPFGATCVLLFAAPDSPLAQPRNVIGGHLISSLVGLVFLQYIGAGPIEMGIAVGVAIALMQLTRTLHAPAGADPLVVMMMGNATWWFLVEPVLISSLLLVFIALIVNNSGKLKKWPKYWM